MIKTITLSPGVTLRCFPHTSFKQSCLSIQFLRPMCREEASLNALLPAVLLRGTEQAPDLRAITLRLDDLYGASVGAMVRRVGDCQTTGLYCSFMEDRFAFGGDAVMAPMIGFLEELLLRPRLEQEAFYAPYVDSEKANLISAIEALKNDKQAYAMTQLLKIMCSRDSLGIPRTGEIPQVRAITPQSLYAHYRRVISQSQVHLFYVGSAEPEQVARMLTPLARALAGQAGPAPAQTGFHTTEPSRHTEVLDVAQGKLCMGYLTDICFPDPRFAAMQVANTVLGAGMTSKLFMNVREKQSLCYDIGSRYFNSKGIVTVSAGIDSDRQAQVEQEIARQLEACCQGDITPEELEAARQMLCSQLESVHDSPGAIERYYAPYAITGTDLTPEQYLQAIREVTVSQAAEAARTLKLHTVYFLKGAQ